MTDLVFLRAVDHRPPNGPFERGRSPPWQGARKQPVGLNGPFSAPNGPFSRMLSWAVFPFENPLHKSPLRKGQLISKAQSTRTAKFDPRFTNSLAKVLTKMHTGVYTKMSTEMPTKGEDLSGKSKGGLSKGGLGPKGANWAKKGPFGAISALPPWLWGAEELVPIGPEKAPIGPEKVPICPENARFCRKDFPPDFLRKFGA